MFCSMFFGITTLTREGILFRFLLCNNFYNNTHHFDRILKRDIQWLLDFGYKIVIPWLLRGISEQNALTLGLRPRDAGVLFGYTPSTHGITTRNVLGKQKWRAS